MGAKIRKQIIKPILILTVHDNRIFLYFCSLYSTTKLLPLTGLLMENYYL